MSIFSNIKAGSSRGSKFNLSHERKLSFNMGQLIPIMLEEIIPGDKFKVNSEILLRLAPLIAPMMHRVNVYTHFFYVPNRIVWNEWENFITGGLDGTENPIFPTLPLNTTTSWEWSKGMLPDYFGIPTNGGAHSTDQFVNALPFRAYAEIYNEYYLDQNLAIYKDYDKGSGIASASEVSMLIEVQKRAWEKDYFTSCLPWAQKGGDVEIPADISYKDSGYIQQSDGTNPSAQSNAQISPLGFFTNQADTEAYKIDNIDSLGITVNDLRKSVRVQEWLEKMARGGSRYAELLLNMFNVRSSDARLDRPEYLGGGKSPVVISEVLNTAGDPSGTTPTTAVGEMAGHGISVGANHGFNRRFEEHGYVIGIMSVMPRTAYQNGLQRHWSYQDKYDYYWKQFANLGEQEVKNKEVFWRVDGPMGDPEATFGYQSRYAHLKSGMDSVHGDFRDSLSYWHQGRIFSGAQTLNRQFIEADPTERVFAVTDPDQHKLYCQIYNNISAIRPMPYFGTPRL